MSATSNTAVSMVASQATDILKARTAVNLYCEIILDKLEMEKNFYFIQKGLYYIGNTRTGLRKENNIDVNESLVSVQAESSVFLIILKSCPEETLPIFLEAISKNNRLTALEFHPIQNKRYTTFFILESESDINIILRTCGNSLSSLRELTIGHNWISRKDLKELLGLLHNPSSILTALDVARPLDFTDELEPVEGQDTFDSYFCEFLTGNSTLLSLTIRGFLHNAQKTAKSLIRNNTLTCLSLVYYELSYKTIREFSKVLKSNTTLKALNLYLIEDVTKLKRNIKDISLDFAEALLMNRALTECVFDAEALTKKGAEIFARALEETNVLKVLDFGQTPPASKKIEDNKEAFTIIAKALTKNRSLSVLVINDAITTKGVITFQEALKLNTNLYRLVIRPRVPNDTTVNYVQDHYIDAKQARKLERDLVPFIKRNCLLNANWWRVDVLISFRRANSNHPFIDSIFPIINIIAKMFEESELDALQSNDPRLDEKRLSKFLLTKYYQDQSRIVNPGLQSVASNSIQSSSSSSSSMTSSSNIGKRKKML